MTIFPKTGLITKIQANQIVVVTLLFLDTIRVFAAKINALISRFNLCDLRKGLHGNA